jgi:hypothetical protein
MRQTLFAASIVALFSGCGGGGDSGPPQPVTSTSTFPVRAALDAMVAAPGINVNLVGRDNAAFTVDQPQSTRPNDWTGTFSISKRVATLANTPAGCTGAATLVDTRVVLTRFRDGYRMQEGATIGYTADYRPLCAFLLDGNFWFWGQSQPLPEASAPSGNLSGIESGGTTQGTGFPAATVTSLVALDPDTASTAYLSLVFHLVPVPDPVHAPPENLPFQMFGETTEFRFKIDPSGAFKGFQYLRTGVMPASTNPYEVIHVPVTIQMTSQ